MTSYQEHIMIKMDVETYDYDNNLQRLGDKLPRNNEDALRLMLFPNGWSNLTRTGRVMHLMAPGSDDYMYVVHYMENEQIAGHNEGDSMGWPEGVDFISYKVLYFDYDYTLYNCRTDDKWNLTDHYSKLCKEGGSDLKWFFGFKRTR